MSEERAAAVIQAAASKWMRKARVKRFVEEDIKRYTPNPPSPRVSTSFASFATSSTFEDRSIAVSAMSEERKFIGRASLVH
jgi:hypothetical protein